MCSVYFHRYHSRTTWVEKFKSYVFYERDLAPALISEASSDRAKFCCVVAALFAFNRLLKSREKFKQPYLQFFKALARGESLVSRDERRDEILVSRESGNLLLSGTLDNKSADGKFCFGELIRDVVQEKLLGAQRLLIMISWVPSTKVYMKKGNFSSRPKIKVSHLWHPGASRAQP